MKAADAGETWSHRAGIYLFVITVFVVWIVVIGFGVPWLLTQINWGWLRISVAILVLVLACLIVFKMDYIAAHPSNLGHVLGFAGISLVLALSSFAIVSATLEQTLPIQLQPPIHVDRFWNHYVVTLADLIPGLKLVETFDLKDRLIEPKTRPQQILLVLFKCYCIYVFFGAFRRWLRISGKHNSIVEGVVGSKE